MENTVLYSHGTAYSWVRLGGGERMGGSWVDAFPSPRVKDI